MTVAYPHNPPENNTLLTLAERAIAESGAELAGAYRKAVSALLRYFPSGRLLLSDFSLPALRDWIVAMLCGNCSISTVLYYLENVGALYNRAVKLGVAEKTDAFRILKSELLSAEGEALTRNIKDSLSSLSRLAKGRVRLVGDMEYYADLLLFSFYGRGLPIADILAMPASALEPGSDYALPAEALKIAGRYCDKRRSRIFPRGAVDTVEQRVKMIAHHIGLDTPPDMTVGEITSRLWILAALRLGIPAGTIAACRLPEASNLAIISFAKSDEELPVSEIAVIAGKVARSIADNPMRWHVMKLRPHHTDEEVRGRLDGSKFKHIEYFYPQEEISKRIGKKLEFNRKPILPYVLFFRSKDSDIAPMFKQVGDLAWCYRYTPRGAYAEISRTEMERFQRTIGRFTSDFSIEPMGTESGIGIGEMVRITGGPMAGYEGIVYKIEDSPAARLFRLLVTGENGIEWKMDIDERQIERINTDIPESDFNNTPPDAK